MNQFEIFQQVAFDSSKLVTRRYSTSFSIAVRFLDASIREAIYAIYGFVRLADEIVDTFHDYNKKELLDRFEEDYYYSFRTGIGLNPILHAFQLIVKKYQIEDELIQAFLTSMRADLTKSQYESKRETDLYVYGSADVVGLMCLKVFVEGNANAYEQLKVPAMKLGSAFQKVNFLRDIHCDLDELGRSYFHQIGSSGLTVRTKDEIIAEIEDDFREALKGITLLPNKAKPAVMIAFTYYRQLLAKIKKQRPEALMTTRITIPWSRKFVLLLETLLRYKLGKI